jgi:hypothetical protein
LFEEPDDLDSVAIELRTVLFQSNLIQKSDSNNDVTQPATRDDAARGDEDESPPPKRQRTDLPTRSVTPNNTLNNDPWKLQPLLLLANSDLTAFVQHELFIFVLGEFFW